MTPIRFRANFAQRQAGWVSLCLIYALIAALFLLPAGLASPASAQGQPQSQVQTQVQPPAQSEPYVGQVTFYSHSFGENFPHAFVIVEQRNALGQTSFDAYGFSARNLSPALLWGTVNGHIAIPGERYVRQSDPHFTVPMTRAQAEALTRIRANWAQGPGSRYNLDRRNCVHFVAELAEVLGLRTEPDSSHFRAPNKFLREVVALNPERFGVPG
jgi:hypothetical protein